MCIVQCQVCLNGDGMYTCTDYRTLRRSWDQLKTETENIGRLHMQLSVRIQEEMLKSIREFRIQQKDIRKRVCTVDTCMVRSIVGTVVWVAWAVLFCCC